MTGTALIVVDDFTSAVYQLDPPLQDGGGWLVHQVKLVTSTHPSLRMRAVVHGEWDDPRLGTELASIPLVLGPDSRGARTRLLTQLGYTVVSDFCHWCGQPDPRTTWVNTADQVATDCECGPVPDGLVQRILQGLVSA